MLIFDL